MRSIRIDASARHSTGVVIPPARVSSGANLSAMSEFSCILPDISHPTSYLPSHRSGFASLSSHRSKSGIGAMKVLTPAALTPHGGSLRLLCLVFRTSSPQPRYAPERRFHSRLNALDGSYDPGFATNEQARRAMPPKRVRHPTGCSFASSCSPPRIAATQLPSATCVTTSHRTDSHPPDKATSQTHSFPRKRESNKAGNLSKTARNRQAFAGRVSWTLAFENRVREHDCCLSRRPVPDSWVLVADSSA